MSDARHARLVSLGIDPVGGDRGDTVVLPPALDAVATRRLIEILNAGRGAGSVLIVCPTWADALTLRRLRVARAAVEHGRVGVVLTSLPPLATRVLLSQAHELLTHGVAGWAHTVLGALERQYVAFAALPSIRGLRHPAPSFGQHVVSMAPGTGFVAMTHPTPEVRRIRSGGALDLPLPPTPRRPSSPMRPAAPTGCVPASSPASPASPRRSTPTRWARGSGVPTVTPRSSSTRA